MAHEPSEIAAATVEAQSSVRRSRWPSRVEVGRILKAHGVRGEVTLEIWGELGESLRPGAALYLQGRETEVLSLRGAGDRVLARLDGVDSRDAAEEVRGQVLSVASSALPLPADGEVYLFELEGCRVEVEPADDGGDAGVNEIGSVRRVIEDGGGLLLEVAGRATDSAEDVVYLIPYVAAYLRARDLGRGVLRFSLPEGLLETCVSTS